MIGGVITFNGGSPPLEIDSIQEHLVWNSSKVVILKTMGNSFFENDKVDIFRILTPVLEVTTAQM